MRARARATVAAFAERTADFGVVYASKAFPCTAALRLFAEEGLLCDVASGGELHLALRAGFDPERLYMHGNNKTEAELEEALDAGVGHIVVDSLDEIDRLGRLSAASGQRVLLRVAPGIEPDTHAKIATGQEDSKFGIPLPHAQRAIEACQAAGLELRGLHSHLGSQVFELDVYETLGQVLTGLADLPVVSMGGGFAVAYTRDQRPPAPAAYAEAMLSALPAGEGRAVRARALAGGQRLRDALHRRHGEGDPGRAHVRVGGRRHVGQHSPDALRRRLRGSDRRIDSGRATACRIAGMHCESGDVLVPDASLAEPRPGDLLAVPATGAYGHAMANNYNAVRRPPVVFCRDGDARVVVRRETYDDLTLRDA